MSQKEKIIIVGAGLCGTLLAIRLAQRGYFVHLYERRGDMSYEQGVKLALIYNQRITRFLEEFYSGTLKAEKLNPNLKGAILLGKNKIKRNLE